jgi:quercetin dioxygenase-like cupin family protein
MRVVKISDLPEESMGEATPIAGWTGGAVSRSRQTIIPDGDSDNYRCSVVNFKPGATTGWHAHTCDQILVVTGGSGTVATEHEERDISVGDVGERHWHGAKANTTLSHITITTTGAESRR